MAISAYASIYARLFFQPLLIEPMAASVVLNAISGRLGIAEIVVDGNVLTTRQISDSTQQQIRDRREYSVSNGVATVPIFGELANRSVRLQPASGLTGYSSIGHNIDLAIADQDVRGILLDIDSPGGEVGARDLAQRIKALDTAKPIWALIDNMGASAAYFIAAAADRIIVPGEATSGSIGSIAMIPNMQRALDQQGISVSIVRSGQMKAKPNMIEPIDEATMGMLTKRIKDTGEEFVNTVAAFRGVSQRTVRDTEASVIFGQDMVDLKLADVSQAAHETRSEFEDYVNGRKGASRRNSGTGQSMATRTIVNPSTGDRRTVEVRPGQAISMSGDELLVPEGYEVGDYLALVTGRAPTAQAAIVPPLPTAAAPPAAVAMTAEQAVAAERTRIATVLSMPEARGREAYATRLATSGLTTEQIAAILSEPRQEAPPARETAEPRRPESSPFHAALIAAGNPQVGPDQAAPGAVPAGVGQVDRSPFGPNPPEAQAAAGMILNAVPKEMRRQ